MKSVSATRRGQRRLAGGQHLRLQTLDLGKIERHRKQKDTAVPEMVARGDVTLGGRGIRFFDKAGDRERALDARDRSPLGDIAVAGLGTLWRDAKGDQMPAARGRRGALGGVAEGVELADHVIGRHHQHQRVGLARGQPQRGDAGRRRGIATDRFEHQRIGRGADLAQLLGDDKPVLLIGDDQRRRKPGVAPAIAHRAQHGLLQQAALANERQQLLRVERARHRPQPRPRASRQDHRMNHAILPTVTPTFPTEQVRGLKAHRMRSSMITQDCKLV